MFGSRMPNRNGYSYQTMATVDNSLMNQTKALLCIIVSQKLQINKNEDKYSG